MRLKKLELSGFKSFAKKTTLLFDAPITAIVGPNGSGKSNVAEAFRWVLGEQSMKSLRGKKGEDLIWNGSDREPRAGRAVAAVTFDNTDRRFNLDFEEVTLSREVHRDGNNEYKINGSTVRLRDVLELLAQVSLGPSGHHIVSQGDADRILSASIHDRKAMIEDALGLKVFQWKLAESRKKLEQTEVNRQQVESLRREIAPHLKFLKKQVEKIERADEYRKTLKDLYKTYLSAEASYLAAARQELAHREALPREELNSLEKRIAAAEELVSKTRGGQGRRDEALIKKETELNNLRNKKDDLARKLGRLEGLVEAKQQITPSDRAVGLAPIRSLVSDLMDLINDGERLTDLTTIKRALGAIKNRLNTFLHHELENSSEDQAEELKKLLAERETLLTELSRVETMLTATSEQYGEMLASRAAEKEDSFAAERDLFALRARRNDLLNQLELVKSEAIRLDIEDNDLKREIEEGASLVDLEIREFAKNINDKHLESRPIQEARRKEIERLKLRLEDMGVESTEVLNEFKQANERDEFLAKELTDLEESAISLKKIMGELETELEKTFSEGLIKINEQFSNFFSLMFGGGLAKLVLVTPEKRKSKKMSELDILEGQMEMGEETEEEGGEAKPGIDIDVSLPRKKIRGLQMLSGGERALTSIALLFAIASVNPPPFLILDETDAALDEANSRKYGEMIATLAQSSQLILITHNRETMSRAGVLYGVTMGGDGVSKILSVRFEEAQSFAK